MPLSEFLYSVGVLNQNFEGFCQQIKPQVEDLIHIIKDKPNVKIMEIGFNGGHSSELFLEYNKTSTVLSFDIGHHDYVKYGKEYIDRAYPNRHTLIIGNSIDSIPKYKNETFDIIFIDGDHEYDVAIQDLKNCMCLSNKDTIVILDDTVTSDEYHQSWTIGPTKAWKEFKNKGLLTEHNSKTYEKGRGMSWGKYIIN